MKRLLQGRLNSEDLAGVHDPVRVEHRFDCLHVFDFNWRAAIGQVIALGHAHTVLGGDRAVVLRDGFEHPLVHGGALGEELVLAQVFRLEDVQVQVAVADMAEPDNFEVGVVFTDDRVNFLQECRYFRYRYRNVVLVRRPVGNGLGDVLAQLPQVVQLGFALAHHAVQHPALLDAVLEGFQGVVGDFFGGGFEFQQCVERAFGLERRRHVTTTKDFGQGLVGEKLESGQVQLALERVQHRHDRVEVGGRGHLKKEIFRRTVQAHGGFHDKTQGAFGADEQLAHVVAGGVLDQVAVQLQHVAFAGDDLHAGDPVTGHAVANYLDPAGIGADIAANLARTGRSEVHRVVQAVLFGGVLQLLGDHARLALGGAVGEVHVQDLVHIVERDDHFTIGSNGGGRQAGTPTGRHQRDLALIGPAHDGLHLLNRLGEHDGSRGRREVLGPILAVSLQGVGVGQHFAGLNQGL